MEIEYIDEQIAELPIDTNYEELLKPSKTPCVQTPKVFRPVLAPKANQTRKKPVVVSKSLKRINRPIEKIQFATLDEYLNYKKLYG